MKTTILCGRIVAQLADGPKTSRQIRDALKIDEKSWYAAYDWLIRNRVAEPIGGRPTRFRWTGLTVAQVIKSKKGRPGNGKGSNYVTPDPTDAELTAMLAEFRAADLARMAEPKPRPRPELPPVEQYRREWRRMMRNRQQQQGGLTCRV